MGIDRKTFMTCNRCGNKIEISEEEAAIGLPGKREGWVLLDGNRALCPQCSPGYELLKARHLVEIDDYLSGRSPK